MKFVLHNVLNNVLANAAPSVEASAAANNLPALPLPTRSNVQAGFKWAIEQDMVSRPWEWSDNALTLKADVMTLRYSAEAAKPYVEFAKGRKQLAAEASWRWHLIRYVLGMVLLHAPEMRGGDRSKKEQNGKFSSLLPGERYVYDNFNVDERKLLRKLPTIPHPLYVATLNKAKGDGKCLANDYFKKLAARIKREKNQKRIQAIGAAADEEIKKDAELTGAAGMEKWMLLRGCKFQDLDKLLAEERKTNPEKAKTFPLLSFPLLDAIITDPPYDRDAVKSGLFPELAKFADKHLKPKAPLVMMVGGCYCQEIIKQVEATGFFLRWQMAVLYTKGESKLRQPWAVNSKWKPVLVFQRESERNESFRSLRHDWIMAGPQPDEEDIFHDWQQEVSTFQDLVSRFAEPKWTICDPCMGWATTAQAAFAEHICFIGCEMLPDRFHQGLGLCKLAWDNRQASFQHLAEINRKPLSTEPSPSVKPVQSAEPATAKPDDKEVRRLKSQLSKWKDQMHRWTFLNPVKKDAQKRYDNIKTACNRLRELGQVDFVKQFSQEVTETFAPAWQKRGWIQSSQEQPTQQGKKPDAKPRKGVQEWSDDKGVNCFIGCQHDCWYCYAAGRIISTGQTTAENWHLPRPAKEPIKSIGGVPRTLMFPSSHDITPETLPTCIKQIRTLLEAGHFVLIVSKPHVECIQKICDEFKGYRDKILFRFTICSTDNATLRLWEPNAPPLAERLKALKLAKRLGFQTSVSSEPMLDGNVDDLVKLVEPHVTETIWIGRMSKQTKAYLTLHHAPAEVVARYEQLSQIWTDDFAKKLYQRLKGNSKLRWKDSIKEVVGIPLLTT